MHQTKMFRLAGRLLLLLICFSRNHAWSPSHLPFARSQRSFSTFLLSTSSDIASPPTSSGGISIRECEYSELAAVSDVVLESFYDRKARKGPWKQVYRLAELNRLQQNFPYQDTNLHQMLVAIDDDTEMVLGFVDIDARPCKTKRKLPRPYLSDLCIHEDFRRRGIANRLVKACEEFTRKIPRPELWIRVKDDNIAAVQMYKKLDYSIIGTDDEENDIIILHKKFEEASNPNEELNSASSDT